MTAGGSLKTFLGGVRMPSCRCALRPLAPIWLPRMTRARSSRRRRSARTRRRSATKDCCRCSTPEARRPTSAGSFERLGSHGQSKAVLRFTAPAEVKGVALLVVNHPDRASDQWMWTPAIERDRRIALQDRSTRFFGTDFSFEDLEERDVDQYEYTSLGDETVDGAACWKIQSTPKQSKSSQYTRSIVWIRKDNYAFARIENYVKDQVGAPAELLEHPERAGHLDRAKQLEMTDLRRGSRTRLTLDKLEYNVPMKDEDFTLQAIRRQ